MEDRVNKGSSAGEQPIGAWASSETHDLADAARQRRPVDSTYVDEAKEYVQGAVQQTRDYVEGARDYFEGAVQQTRDKMVEYREGGFQRMKHDMATYTREQPMTALLIAAGAGLVVGWLSAAGRR
jgi:ElaB/YqjD/DUF883 family membrane-anchored ribosome-binding protein